MSSHFFTTMEPLNIAIYVVALLCPRFFCEKGKRVFCFRPLLFHPDNEQKNNLPDFLFTLPAFIKKDLFSYLEKQSQY